MTIIYVKIGATGKVSNPLTSVSEQSAPANKTKSAKITHGKNGLTALVLTLASVGIFYPFSQASAANFLLYTVTDNNQLAAIDVDTITNNTFPATTIIGVTQDANNSTVRRTRGLAYGNGMMYGMTREGDLVSINLSTAETKLLYTLPFGIPTNEFWSGLAFDGTNKLYTTNAFGASELVEITLSNPSTVISSQVVGSTSAFNLNFQILGLDFYPSSAPLIPPTFNGTHPTTGVLYGSNRNNDNIVTVSPLTGAVTFTFGNATINVPNVQEIAFHPGTGELYTIHDHSSTSNNAALSTYNFTTNTATELGELPFGIVENVGGGNGTYGWGGLAFAPKAVPEPTSNLKFLALGTLGAASTLKRKLKTSKKETTKVS